jgi:hypothetical protein
MKKIVCGFVFGLMLMVAGAQAWADGLPISSMNPKFSVSSQAIFADGLPIPPTSPDPKLNIVGW